MKRRHALYLSEVEAERLASIARANGLTKSAILEQALVRFLSPTTSPPQDGLQSLQQLRNEKRLQRLERDIAIVSETTATFVQYFLTVTPPLSEAERAAAQARGRTRYDQFIELVASRLRTDASLMSRVAAALRDDPADTDPDRASQDDDDATPSNEPEAERQGPERADR